MERFKKILIPAAVALVFVLLSATAIFLKAYQVEGVFPSVSEIFFTVPICYFWLLWFGLIYFCANGIVKEYHLMVSIAQNEFPELSTKQIKGLATTELAYSYSKKLLLLFIGLPFCIELVSFDYDLSQISIQSVLILLIPFFIDSIVFIILVINRRKSNLDFGCNNKI